MKPVRAVAKKALWIVCDDLARMCHAPDSQCPMNGSARKCPLTKSCQNIKKEDWYHYYMQASKNGRY